MLFFAAEGNFSFDDSARFNKLFSIYFYFVPALQRELFMSPRFRAKSKKEYKERKKNKQKGEETTLKKK